jgi:hypothetical protein
MVAYAAIYSRNEKNETYQQTKTNRRREGEGAKNF